MKKYFLAFALLIGLTMIGCKERAYIDGPGDNKYNLDSIPIMKADTNGIEISVDSALSICKALAPDAETGELYKLTGVITAMTTSPSDIPSKYTNINFKLSDNGGKTSISCYYTNNLNNRPFRNSKDIPAVGTKLAVLGVLTNYKGTTPELKNGFIVRIDSVPPAPDTIIATCEEAKAAALALPNNNEPTKDIYIITGYVQNDGYSATVSRDQQTFWIADTETGGKVFEAYWCNVPNGQAVQVGQKVKLTGPIMKYNTTAEMKNGDVEIVE